MGKWDEQNKLLKAAVREREHDWRGVKTIVPKTPKKAAPQPGPREVKGRQIEIKERKSRDQVYPRIVLDGKWLTDADYLPGAKLIVTIINNQILINRKG